MKWIWVLLLVLGCSKESVQPMYEIEANSDSRYEVSFFNEETGDRIMLYEGVERFDTLTEFPAWDKLWIVAVTSPYDTAAAIFLRKGCVRAESNGMIIIQYPQR